MATLASLTDDSLLTAVKSDIVNLQRVSHTRLYVFRLNCDVELYHRTVCVIGDDTFIQATVVKLQRSLNPEGTTHHLHALRQ